VYGIIYNNQQQILLSTEVLNDYTFTKFPGGGLEFGEGTKDCIAREFKEETGIEVTVVKHIYTTDYFQQSAFNPHDQVISIYYQVESKETDKIRTDAHLLADRKHEAHTIHFFWVYIKDLLPEMLSFPIDKHVATLLREWPLQQS
jgi:ADP-ribose pyrophosphatase YjhB (NUDIX family)